MKLYYLPGACSLTIHIALQWIGKPFEAQKMDRQAIKAPDYLKINPMGSVPAISDGDFDLNQNLAILSYLSAKHPEAGLLGDGTPQSLAETMRWLAFINSDLHRTFSLVFGPARFVSDAAAQQELAASAAKILLGYFTMLDGRLEGRDYLTGAKRTAADAYLFVVLRWAQAMKIDLSGLANLPKFNARMKADSGVAAALKAEGLE
ncbi:glutathione binding-like protein [Bordetella sp. FB-8]|uniref:glutathione binding-like protein n=1 Tax=Bordetella sp. FB-8 TaxID=1159870 RepID=UPI000370FDB2|nr:glutathione binding-like protein [Bordetella sp. FB-8]